MEIKWTPALSVGNEFIDGQHQELIRRVAKFVNECEKGVGKNEVKNLLGFLGEYVVQHFQDEEQLQQKISYPAYPAHKKQHDAFIESWKGLHGRFEEEGATPSLMLEFHRAVIDWVINHVTKTDKLIGDFAKSKGIK